MPLFVRFTTPARADILDILEWSADKFGDAARTRYEALIDLAVTQIAATPDAVPARKREEIGAGLWAIHLRSIERGEVGEPRHIVFYRFDDTAVLIVRVLHESRELASALRGY